MRCNSGSLRSRNGKISVKQWASRDAYALADGEANGDMATHRKEDDSGKS